jgi:histidine ammonia-lyase
MLNGTPLPTEIVRAALALRLNGMARGGSGHAAWTLPRPAPVVRR